jgi:DNA-binding GntR family transcriptional regulator
MTRGPQRTITEHILTQIRDMIMEGTLPPGSRIDQAELTERFAVSLVPVREALARLQSSGLVRIVPHRGVFVEELSAEELVDIYGMREVLEEYAARLAAEHLATGDVAHLEQLLREQELAADAAEFADFLDLNRTFHFVIYRAAQRPHLLQTITQLWDRSQRYRQLQLHAFPNRAQQSLVESQAIVAACRRRERDALGMMVRYKIHQTSVGLLEKMQAATHTQPYQRSALTPNVHDGYAVAEA